MNPNRAFICFVKFVVLLFIHFFLAKRSGHPFYDHASPTRTMESIECIRREQRSARCTATVDSFFAFEILASRTRWIANSAAKRRQRPGSKANANAFLCCEMWNSQPQLEAISAEQKPKTKRKTKTQSAFVPICVRRSRFSCRVLLLRHGWLGECVKDKLNERKKESKH